MLTHLPDYAKRGIRTALQTGRSLLLAAATAVLLYPTPCPAADPYSETVGVLFNWYYATSFGTGVYSVGDTTVTAVNLPFHYTVREPTDTDWGWRLTVPVTAAFGNFNLYDPDFNQIDKIHLAALSVMPGAELIYPLRPYWRLNGFANIGRAWEFETQAGATIYQVGLSTHYQVPDLHNPDIEIGAKYIYAGYASNGEDSVPVSLVSLGVSSSFALPWTLSENHESRLGLHIIGTSYLTDLRFRLPEVGYTTIHGDLEAGLSLRLRPALKILGGAWDRVGISYVAGSNGLRGYRLVTEFPF